MGSIQKLLGICLFLFITSCTRTEVKEISVLKFVTHPALDEMENAFSQTLDSLLTAEGLSDQFEISTYNANASFESAKSIAESFEYNNSALIFTIATPAAIAVKNTKSEIPHIYGAVADPIGAKIIPSERSTGIQNAGEGIIIEALKVIRAAFPDAKKLGSIYNSSEQNSIYVQNLIEDNSTEFGFELKQISTSSPDQVPGLVEILSEEVDVIYSANDNMVNSAIFPIIQVTNKKQTPFIIGDLSTLKDGPLLAIGLEYDSMGDSLAHMAFSILNGASINRLPPLQAPTPSVWFNTDTAEDLEYTLPDSLTDRVTSKSFD